MTRTDLIERLNALSDDEVARIAPYLEANLDAVADIEELREEVRRGRASAADEGLLDDDEVLQSVLDRLARKA